MPAMTIITASVSTLVSHVITILLRRPTPSNQNAQKTLQQFLMILAHKFEGTVENIVRINSLNMQTDTFKCNLHTTINNLRLYEDQLSHLDAAAAAGTRTYSMWRSVLLPNIIRSGNHSKVYSTAAKLLMLLVATDMTLLQKCYERPGISSAQQQAYIRMANEHKAAFWDDAKKSFQTHDSLEIVEQVLGGGTYLRSFYLKSQRLIDPTLTRVRLRRRPKPKRCESPSVVKKPCTDEARDGLPDPSWKRKSWPRRPYGAMKELELGREPEPPTGWGERLSVRYAYGIPEDDHPISTPVKKPNAAPSKRSIEPSTCCVLN